MDDETAFNFELAVILASSVAFTAMPPVPAVAVRFVVLVDRMSALTSVLTRLLDNATPTANPDAPVNASALDEVSLPKVARMTAELSAVTTMAS